MNKIYYDYDSIKAELEEAGFENYTLIRENVKFTAMWEYYEGSHYIYWIDFEMEGKEIAIYDNEECYHINDKFAEALYSLSEGCIHLSDIAEELGFIAVQFGNEIKYYADKINEIDEDLFFKYFWDLSEMYALRAHRVFPENDADPRTRLFIEYDMDYAIGDDNHKYQILDYNPLEEEDEDYIAVLVYKSENGNYYNYAEDGKVFEY